MQQEIVYQVNDDEDDEIQEEEHSQEIQEDDFEENVDDDVSSEDDFEEEEEPSPREKKQSYTQLKRDRFRKLQQLANKDLEINARDAEIENLRTTLANLQSFSEKSHEAALHFYDKNARLKLDSAKDRYAKSLVDGTERDIAESASDLAKANSEMHDIDNLLAKENMRKKQLEDQKAYQRSAQERYVPQNHPSPPALNEHAVNWIRSNSWIKKDSPDFDPDLAEEVGGYVRSLESSLNRQGRSHEINTPQFFRQIDKYLYETGAKMNRSRSEINMRTQKNVSPVSNKNRTEYKNQEQTLTKHERGMMEAMGLTKQEFLKYRDIDRKNNNSDGQYTYRIAD